MGQCTERASGLDRKPPSAPDFFPRRDTLRAILAGPCFVPSLFLSCGQSCGSGGTWLRRRWAAAQKARQQVSSVLEQTRFTSFAKPHGAAESFVLCLCGVASGQTALAPDRCLDCPENPGCEATTHATTFGLQLARRGKLPARHSLECRRCPWKRSGGNQASFIRAHLCTQAKAEPEAVATKRVQMRGRELARLRDRYVALGVLARLSPHRRRKRSVVQTRSTFTRLEHVVRLAD